MQSVGRRMVESTIFFPCRHCQQKPIIYDNVPQAIVEIHHICKKIRYLEFQPTMEKAAASWNCQHIPEKPAEEKEGIMQITRSMSGR